MNDNLQCLNGSCSTSDLLTAANSTLLTSHPARIAMILFAIAHIIFTHKVIFYNQELRKKINGQMWFGIQLLLHPLIVGGTVYLANITGNEWYGLLGLPFIFNFAAEPLDLTKIPSNNYLIFQMFIYLHHAGPLLACWTCFSIPNNAQFALANALLYAHTWSLHTIGSLDYKKVLNKQKLFWPYMLTMLLVGYSWCRTLSPALDEVRLSTVLPLLVGPFFQFVGRWGLYEYIKYFLGYPQPGNPMYDKFETNKQLGEITAFTIAAAAVVFYR